MNLLIVGAGEHGRVVEEIASCIRDKDGNPYYSRIDFLDDHAEGAIGTINNMDAYVKEYDEFIIGIGNNGMRENLQEYLCHLGCRIATLIHPAAYISPSAEIGEGSVVEPGAIVNTHANVGKGCIISAGAIVDHDAVLESFCHINVGTICKGGSRIEHGKKLQAGEVVLRKEK